MLCPSGDERVPALPLSARLLQSDEHKGADALTKVSIIYSSRWLVRLPKYEFKKKKHEQQL